MANYHTSVIRLYAQALFDFAIEKKGLNLIEKEVSNIRNLLSRDPNMVAAIANPTLSISQQELVLRKVIPVLKLSKNMENFFIVLVRNKRLSVVAEILDAFAVIFSKYNNEKIVQAIVSQELSLKEQESIKDKLEQQLSSKVSLSFKTDPKILGGIMINIENKLFDASLRNQFTYLSNLVEKKIAVL